MKRFIQYNSAVAFGFLLLWALLVVVEVKLREFEFLKFIFFLSLFLVFVGFFAASFQALRNSSKHPVGFALLSSLLLSPVFIFLGVTLVTNFKFMIGGSL